MNINQNRRLALLIDADNAQAKAIEAILNEAARYGDVTTRRCYGDWTDQKLIRWKDILHRYALQPIQQFANTKGKNATDVALIIDAMDLLYTGNFDGFILISSDSDFTKLATRLREAGLEVIGIGERKTPEPFRVACNKFIYTETLIDETINQLEEIKENRKNSVSNNTLLKGPDKSSLTVTLGDLDLKKLISEAIDSASEEDGWANLGGVGSYINRINSSFDARNQGFKSLSKLIRSLNYVEIDERKTSEGGATNTYIKLKEDNA